MRKDVCNLYSVWQCDGDHTTSQQWDMGSCGEKQCILLGCLLKPTSVVFALLLIGATRGQEFLTLSASAASGYVWCLQDPMCCIHLSWVWTLQFEIPIGWFWGGILQCNDNRCKIPKMRVLLWIGSAQHHKSLSFRGVMVCFLLHIEHAIHMHWDIKCWSYNQPQGYKVPHGHADIWATNQNLILFRIVMLIDCLCSPRWDGTPIRRIYKPWSLSSTVNIRHFWIKNICHE